MINFRFYLVSLVAVFLALALGVVVGSAFVDRAIVEGLRSRIDDVEKRSGERRKENLELKQSLGALETYAEQVVPHLVGRRLEGVPLAVVAVRGVDGGVVSSALDTLRSAGALVPGVVWVESIFGLTDAEATAKLGEAVGDSLPAGGNLTETVLGALGRRLAQGVVPPPGAPPGPSGGQDLLVALSAAGFVTFEAGGGAEVALDRFPPPGSRLLVIDGSEGRVETTVAALPLVRAMAATGAPVALAEVFRPSDSGDARGAVVRGVREDGALAARVATVDDLDELTGQAALALAVEELVQGRAGHYGRAPGARRALPETPPPGP